MSTTPTCPGCGRALQKVKQDPNSMFNAEQFDAARAGDWFCETCPGNGRARTGYRYFWDRDLTAAAPKVAQLEAAKVAEQPINGIADIANSFRFIERNLRALCDRLPMFSGGAELDDSIGAASRRANELEGVAEQPSNPATSIGGHTLEYYARALVAAFNDPTCSLASMSNYVTDLENSLANVARLSPAPVDIAACPDLRNIDEITRSSDQGLHLRFKSTRSCSFFHRHLEEARAASTNLAAPVEAKPDQPEWGKCQLYKPTDLSKRLREHNDPRLYHEADVLMSQAADEIERYYGGMMNWKRTCEAYDRENLAATSVRDAALEESAKACDLVADGFIYEEGRCAALACVYAVRALKSSSTAASNSQPAALDDHDDKWTPEQIAAMTAKPRWPLGLNRLGHLFIAMMAVDANRARIWQDRGPERRQQQVENVPNMRQGGDRRKAATSEATRDDK